jgi:hypothetical protein
MSFLPSRIADLFDSFHGFVNEKNPAEKDVMPLPED